MNREHHLSETSSINASVVSRAKYDSTHNDNQKKRTRTRRRNRKSVFSAMKELIRGPQRLWSVLLFSVIATLGSVVTGITLGYSSPAGPSVLSQLSVTKDWNSWGNSVFGVSLCTTPFCQNYNQLLFFVPNRLSVMLAQYSAVL